MKMMVLYSLMLLVSLVTAWGAHPLGKGLGLLSLSIFVGGFSGTVSSSWLGLLVVLVYAGGMLVLFCYVCCLASMCLFSVKVDGYKLGVMLVVGLSTGLGWFGSLGFGGLVQSSFEGMSVCLSSSYLGVVLLFGVVLCLVLSGVCKMVYIEEGALRPF
uniref:NADH dehydrogenase subunit 6 n=1 Tax=Barbatia decussata TaxID=1508519 RepID=UPI002027F2D9|nr:NADH dehydrogenase subunit 6 [Barbatia decussata]UQT66003.1 NADH dehydrogenase subunit 6 [Barbatia decussata]